MKIQGERYTLYQGDCIDVMAGIPDGCIDSIITDPPYGVTQCAWDSVVNFSNLWPDINRIANVNTPIVIFGNQPFTSALVMSNKENYHHSFVWKKSHPTGHLNCKKQPLRVHEDIVCFGANGSPRYFPQIYKKEINKIRTPAGGSGTNVYGSFVGASEQCFREIADNEAYPQSIIKFNSVQPKNRVHDTQKPLDLMVYIIKTYTREYDTVLDFTMGSGTTGVACMRTNRRFIGIELDAQYFEIAHTRIANAANDFIRTPEEKEKGQLSIFD